MKAIVYETYGSPDVLKIKEVNKPSIGEDEILVNIKSTSVSTADVRARAFKVPPVFWLPARLALGFFKPKKQILGMEFSGYVEAVGKSVSNFKIGDRIVSYDLKEFGSYTMYKRIKSNAPIATIPPSLSYQEAAALPIGGRTALYYLKRSGLKRNQNILIYGASGCVGTYAVQLAHYLGANITAVCRGEHHEQIKALGADKLVDYTVEDFSHTKEKYAIVFDAYGKCPISKILGVLKEGGYYLNPTMIMPSLGMMWLKFNKKMDYCIGKNAPDHIEDLDLLCQLTQEKTLTPVIDKVYAFQDVVEAHYYVDKGHKVGNVILNVSE